MDVLTLLSEKGGVGKTTVTVGLARELAGRGVKVGVVDLDPRATATTWLGVEVRAGEHIGAILGRDDVVGAAQDLAHPSPWHPNIAVIPGHRDVAALEGAPQEYGDVRLRRGIHGWATDVVLVDAPNRQGGFLIRSALTASTRVLYVTTPDEDGRSGVDWARNNVDRFRHLSPVNPDVAEVGVVVTRWPDTIATRDAVGALAALRQDNGPLVLLPLIPERVIVRSARSGEVWWGGYDKGRPVAAAFAQLADQIWPQYSSSNELTND